MKFVEPPWDDPLDAAAAVAAVPHDALIRGYMTMPMIAGIRNQDPDWAAPRDRYLPFNFYPLHEHVQTLVSLATVGFPGLPLRAALRKIGRAAPTALLTTHVGKVTLGAAEGVHNVIAAFAQGYELSVRPCTAQIVSQGAREAVVSFAAPPYFLDSHHVGAWEGVMKHAGVRGSVKICVTEPGAGHFLLQW